MTLTRHPRPSTFTVVVIALTLALVASPALAQPLENVHDHESNQ
jgi:hypothetical protein